MVQNGIKQSGWPEGDNIDILILGLLHVVV